MRDWGLGNMGNSLRQRGDWFGKEHSGYACSVCHHCSGSTFAMPDAVRSRNTAKSAQNWKEVACQIQGNARAQLE